MSTNYPKIAFEKFIWNLVFAIYYPHFIFIDQYLLWNHINVSLTHGKFEFDDAKRQQLGNRKIQRYALSYDLLVEREDTSYFHSTNQKKIQRLSFTEDRREDSKRNQNSITCEKNVILFDIFHFRIHHMGLHAS